MRFVTALVALLAMATAPTVFSDGTECYPGCGASDYTSVIPTTSELQKTAWNELVQLDKFNPQGRVLEKVTINTKLFFKTQIKATCTGEENSCKDTYSATVKPGMEFGMFLDDDGTDRTLERYWGRWGDYPLTTETAEEYELGSPIGPLFVEYTYPMFDIDGFVPGGGTPDFGPRWAYYTPSESADRTIKFFFPESGGASLGTVVGNVLEEYTRYLYTEDEAETTPAAPVTYKLGQGGVETLKDVQVTFDELTYDRTTTPFTQTITRGDPPGGVSNEVSTDDALAFFTGTGQMSWRAIAKALFEKVDTGGNYAIDQASSAYVQMQVIYEYSGTLTNGDPQFNGFHGQSFQVHGYPGSYFHLLSAPSFQMNGRFAYIANGHCTYKHTTCWTHPGTYIDDVTFVVDELLVRVTAGAVARGYTVRINDEPFHAQANYTGGEGEFVPTKFYDAATRLTVHLKSPLELVVRTELFAFTLSNADHFFNIGSQILVRPILLAGRTPSSLHPHPVTGAPWFPAYPIHGFIGQTWANATYARRKLYQGDVDDYVETRPYATESMYSQYNKKFDQRDMHWD